MSLTASPKLIKGGIVLIDPDTAQMQRVIALQYNAESLKRELKGQEAGGEAGADRAEPTRFKGPAVETISFEADLDATDQLEFPDQNPNAVAYGIAPQIAVPMNIRAESRMPARRPKTSASQPQMIEPTVVPISANGDFIAAGC